MDDQELASKLSALLRANNIMESCDISLNGLDEVLPAFEFLRREGAVIVIKLDGERPSPAKEGSPPYTAVITQGRLKKNDYIHFEDKSIERVAARVLIAYLDNN